MFDSVGTWILWLFGLAIIGAIIAFILYIRSFKDIILIKEPIGNTFDYSPNKIYKTIRLNLFKTVKEESTIDETNKAKELEKSDHTINILPFIVKIYKGKIIIVKGIKYIKLYGFTRLFKVPDQVFQAMTSKGKKYIELTKLSEHIYAPTVLVNSRTGETNYVYDESIFSWVVNDIENDFKKYRKASFWDKYGQMITILATLALVLIIVIVTLKYSNEIVQNAVKAVSPLVDALVEATKSLTIQQIK